MVGRLVDSDGEQLATRIDFERLEARIATKDDLKRLKAAFYRVLWIHGTCIVAILAALEFLP